jgi:putative transposase
MPNHYHLLVRQDKEIPTYRFVNSVFNAYVQAVNRQQNRKGPLFEGKYRYVHVDKEEYLIHLCRYIHLNPVQAKLVKNPEDWPYSNFREWAGLRNGKLYVDGFLSDYFDSPMSYSSFCTEFVEGLEMEELTSIKKYRMD